MTSTTVLRSIVAALDQCGIPHMLTGSFAAAYHGAGRATLDVDLVIDPTPDRLRTFVGGLSSELYYVSLDAAEQALQHEGLFNVIDMTSGWKIDLIVRKSTPFHQAEFERRQHVDFEGIPLSVASLEDIILAKLMWARLSESARQIEDVVALVRVRAEDIDLPYLDGWLDALSIREEWGTVCRLVNPDSR